MIDGEAFLQKIVHKMNIYIKRFTIGIFSTREEDVRSSAYDRIWLHEALRYKEWGYL